MYNRLVYYNMSPANKPPRTTIDPWLITLLAAPVNCGELPEPVALPDVPAVVIFAPYPGMLTMDGFVALPASHEGTATADRVTITSAGAVEGQPGVTVMVDVGVALEFWLVYGQCMKR